MLTGLGLKINGKHTLCGDYIYSGHTIVHVTCYLFIRECKYLKNIFVMIIVKMLIFCFKSEKLSN